MRQVRARSNFPPKSPKASSSLHAIQPVCKHPISLPKQPTSPCFPALCNRYYWSATWNRHLKTSPFLWLLRRGGRRHKARAIWRKTLQRARGECSSLPTWQIMHSSRGSFKTHLKRVLCSPATDRYVRVVVRLKIFTPTQPRRACRWSLRGAFSGPWPR